ncbi:TonB-dependent receptor [Sphingomonas sp.]|uniref:TonB-dependent receptor n=1 Tax=Sphingomonas sp. TaxID=28214 RepID=UPI0025DCDB62|nr:TonB-dependent receptor [Sphingomonas sp.]
MSPLAIGLVMLLSAGTAQAQDTGVAPPPAPPQQTEEEKTEVTPTGEVQEEVSAGGTTSPSGDSQDIVVTGFRASLMSAINKKKTSEQVVESVSAEDIGKLPDASIGESIARLPGLTSQRLNGRAAFISIRGFGPDFSTTLLNGREQTSTGDNRAVEFDQYPSEVVNRVDVYKTMTPSLIGQGLVGTVDIRTARPLETTSRVIAVGLKASNAEIGKLNAGSKDFGWRANATYIDKFADDTMGIALSASYVDEPYQIEEYNAWGWQDSGGRIISGNKSWVTSTQLKRYGASATFQADMSDAFRVTLDGFYSKFDDDIIRRGIELPLAGALGWTSAGLTNTQVEDGNVVSGTFTNIEAVVNNHHLTREADLFSGGANLAWRPGNGWKAELDLSISRTDREELILESNAGTGRGFGVGARDTLDFECGESGCTFDPTLDYSDPNVIKLTSPMGWGAGPDTPGGQDGYYNNRIVDDVLKQYRGDVERELGGFLSSVRAGLSLTDRDKSLTPDESYLMLANGAAEMVVPSQYLLRPTNLSYLDLGPVISYDPLALLRDGIYTRVANPHSDIPRKAYDIRENLYAGYVMLNLDGDIGPSRLTGNVGVQAVRTDQESTGAVITGNIFDRATLGDKYWDVLPNLNLSLRTPADLVVRFALARQMQRPRLDQMRVAFGYGVDRTDLSNPTIRGGGGNPELRPYRANAADLTVEKYFGTRGYVAAQLFYKQLKNFIYEQEVPYDYAGLPLDDLLVAPSGIIPEGVPGTISQPVNAKGGKIYGVEIAGTLPFGEFISALDGFGVTGGYGYTKSRVRPEPDGPFGDIPGYSRHVANGTLFFEKWGFGARVSARYRSTFMGEFSGFGANRIRRRAKGETLIDAQIGYDLGAGRGAGTMFNGLSVFAQASNLTDEPFSTINAGAPFEVIDYQSYGRRYQVGATFKF